MRKKQGIAISRHCLPVISEFDTRPNLPLENVNKSCHIEFDNFINNNDVDQKKEIEIVRLAPLLILAFLEYMRIYFFLFIQ